MKKGRAYKETICNRVTNIKDAFIQKCGLKLKVYTMTQRNGYRKGDSLRNRVTIRRRKRNSQNASNEAKSQCLDRELINLVKLVSGLNGGWITSLHSSFLFLPAILLHFHHNHVCLSIQLNINFSENVFHAEKLLLSQQELVLTNACILCSVPHSVLLFMISFPRPA